ncbi:MAG: hypothetical protein KF832_05770 [Caldilineaceae bacterium]|nr:hypothetical protein [Caldilineaceae bacterium]
MSNPPANPVDLEFQQELQAVQQELQQALADLYSPLADLAHSQFQRAQPLTRAAWVLAVGMGDPDSAELRQQRHWLAAAQEMLYIAIRTHKLLLAPSAAHQSEQQKTIMGGIILTGDYCFTRAATLAAQTDRVAVVELFSEALKTISEGLLRNLFAEREGTNTAAATDTNYDERSALFVSGTQAAAILAALPAPATADLVALAHQLHQPTTLADQATLAAHLQQVRALSATQRSRLAAFQSWLPSSV